MLLTLTPVKLFAYIFPYHLPLLTLNWIMMKTKNVYVCVLLRIRQEFIHFNPIIPFLAIILRKQLNIHMKIYVQEYHHSIVHDCKNWKWLKLSIVSIPTK